MAGGSEVEGCNKRKSNGGEEDEVVVEAATKEMQLLDLSSPPVRGGCEIEGCGSKRKTAEVAVEDEEVVAASKKLQLLDLSGDGQLSDYYKYYFMFRRVSDSEIKPRRSCPHLDTVNRQVLDFSGPKKRCQVTFAGSNVFTCLVCGVCYHGRGIGSHTMSHCLEEEHHLYINLTTAKVYYLADGYEVIHPSLRDIRRAVRKSTSLVAPVTPAPAPGM